MTEEFEEKAVLLGKRLKEIYDDEDFIVGILSLLKNEEELDEIINLTHIPQVTDEVIMVRSIKIAQSRRTK